MESIVIYLQSLTFFYSFFGNEKARAAPIANPVGFVYITNIVNNRTAPNPTAVRIARQGKNQVRKNPIHFYA
jgi:hypothetical protein